MAGRKPKAAAPAWQMIEVPLVKLHLDKNNYRHEPVDTEDAAIAALFKPEKVAALAKDIAEQGSLSPLETIGVIPMEGNPDHYIAVEGNRRLCALLLLNDPDRAPTTEAKALMKELAKTAKLPERVAVIKFDSRTVSDTWVKRRHLGPQDGQGLKHWNATQKERAADGGGSNQLAVAILDRAKAGQWMDPAQLPAPTTLTRYLNNPVVRDALGLGSSRELQFTHQHDEVDAALRRFLQDAAPTADGSTPRVNSRSTREDRLTYAQHLRDEGAAPRTRLDAPGAPAAPTPPAGGKSAKGKNGPDPNARKYLVSTGFVCKVKDKSLRTLFNEMRATPIDGHEFANAYLLRALIDSVMTLYLKQVDPGFTTSKDKTRVSRCLKHLDPTETVVKFKPMRTAATDENAAHSLHSLGDVVHVNTVPDRRFLTRAWANWEYALTQMLAAIPTK